MESLHFLSLISAWLPGEKLIDPVNLIFLYLPAEIFKVGLSPSKKICVICLIESLLEMMKNAIYFIPKALFVLKIFKFLSRLFGFVGKTAWLER